MTTPPLKPGYYTSKLKPIIHLKSTPADKSLPRISLSPDCGRKSVNVLRRTYVANSIGGIQLAGLYGSSEIFDFHAFPAYASPGSTIAAHAVMTVAEPALCLTTISFLPCTTICFLCCQAVFLLIFPDADATQVCVTCFAPTDTTVCACVVECERLSATCLRGRYDVDDILLIPTKTPIQR